ncbi:MAG TPA: nucleotidyltransferase domain-containing protein [Ktedonobacterales bacterium]|nr:nucleotidyltransferase domain-containing protein [Ktedonobacterales bacterium]
MLAQRFGGPDIEAIALTGSYARGQAAPLSDVDLLRFAATAPATERERYRLWLVNGRLVSVSTTTIVSKRADLARPESAMWVVPGLRQARILADRDGRLAALIAEAHAFTWTPALSAAAADLVSDTLAGLSEEVHKLLGAFTRGDESAMLYAVLGLQQSLTRAALIARGVLLPSENDYFAEALRLAGPGSRWERLLRVVIGFDATPHGASPARARGETALWLYVEAATLLADTLMPEDAPLVAEAVARIHEALPHAALPASGV